MEVLAIIPARGGSKGLPRKNVLPLAGKPLIAYTIEQALAAEQVTRVVVSTDDAEIADVSRCFGAEVIDRPDEISGDAAGSESALLHTLEQLKSAENYRPDLIAFLQCTAPLTTAEDIDGAITALRDQNADSVLAATAFHYFLWRQLPDGTVDGINHEKSARPLRQDREPQYVETGSVYVMKTAGFLAAKHRFFGTTAMYIVAPEHALEIDEPSEFRQAEALLRLRAEEHQQEALPTDPKALILDFDGVLTDNRVIVSQDGAEAVICSRSDGLGLEELRKMGLAVTVISKERNPVVNARCKKLGIECVHGVDDKLTVMTDWLERQGLDCSGAIYVGNDINDLECMRAAGCAVAVSDAHPEAKAVAQIILKRPGGYGAVRELIDSIKRHLKR